MLCCSLIAAPFLFALNYYFSDNFTNASTSAQNWNINGSASEGSNGLNISSTAGASFISKVAVPDGTAQYEVNMLMKANASGGSYVLYLEATPNALLSQTSIGSFYAIQIGNVVVANGGCTATASLYKAVNGSVTLITSTTIPCGNAAFYYYASVGNDHAIHFWSSQNPTYPSSTEYFSWLDPNPLSGQPGIGGAGMPSSNSIGLAGLQPCDRTGPSAVAASTIQNYAVIPGNQTATLQIQAGGSVDSGTSGLSGYEWYRNGQYVATTYGPEFSDANVSLGSSYTYAVAAEDHDGDLSSQTSFAVTIPNSNFPEPRSVGVSPISAYWGANGENIDLRSGNLNFKLPLLTLKSRNWSVPLSLAYNSQNWRLDRAGNVWSLGRDDGDGFGWKLQIGSLTPFYSSSWNVAYYEFQDANGTEYRLDQNNGGGLWTSKQSIYVTYDANAQTLHFNDGSYWVFGCTSGGTEPDAGTMYPTLLEDSNGNQISIQYAVGANLPPRTNSSSRIGLIKDVRYTGAANTYVFQYGAVNGTVHLTAITDSTGAGESYSFTYSDVTLAPPFSGSSGSYGTASLLSGVTNSATNLTTGFTYDSTGSGELVQTIFPYGGYLRWTYSTAGYFQKGATREVTNRYLLWDQSVGERSYTLQENGSNYAAIRTLVDQTANSQKRWSFSADGTVASLSEGVNGQSSFLRQSNYHWSSDAAGHPYISRRQSINDPGSANSVTKQVDQTVDQYGNVTQTKLYDYGDLTNPAKIYNTAYLSSANGTNYLSLYICNRVAQVTLTDKNGATTTLRTNTYDQYPNGIAPTANVTQQDTQAYGTSYTARGNLYDSALPWGSWHSNYDQTGAALWTGNDINPNHYASSITSTATNYAVPDRITTSNALNTDMTWSASLDMTNQTGANGDLSSMQYDQSDRPQTATSPYGAQTTYAYSTSAPQIVAATNNRWVKTYLDGLGRTAKVERGDSNGVQSSTETVYDTCGCNPLGKVYRKSVPHAPSATANWTVFTYDALGRVLTSVRPDGHSTTAYSYAGSTATVTDPAGKWKQFTRDAFGHIVQVQEPTPNSGAEPNHVTTYTYDVFGHLTGVTMPRTIAGTVRTQTRTWTYDPQTLRLLSKTSPEAGTVNYTYNSDNTLATATDAKNQRKLYSYDQWGRITQIARGTVSNGTFTEDPSQRTTYAYEGTNGGYSSATQGRVSQITYAGPHGLSFVEWYSYHKAGAVIDKRLQVAGANLDAVYTYDNEGHVTSIQYPNSQVNSNATTVAGPKYNYSYDTMERLAGMTDANNNALVSGVGYNAASQLLQLNASNFTEARTYNANLELIELTSGTSVHYKYNYSGTQDNGQIQSQNDVVSGETIVYQYDTLRRLVNAGGTGDPSGAWSQAFTYDGFGNLTQKTASNAPALSVAVDPTTNRIQTNAAYDANGNLTAYAGDQYAYDLQNRLSQANPAGGGTVLYGYDSTNHRVYKGAVSGTTYSAEEIYFYGAEGHKYGTWQLNASSGVLLKLSVTKQWFGNRLLSPQDRLDSRGKYYPYGEERTGVTPPNPPNDQEKFASYTRDSATGLDYADQRYYDNLIGRFMKPDPFGGSANPLSPQSWNRYAYVGNDPANNFDPNGLIDPALLQKSFLQLGTAGASGVFTAGIEIGSGGLATAIGIETAYETGTNGVAGLFNLLAGLFTNPGDPNNIRLSQAANAVDNVGTIPALVGQVFSAVTANTANQVANTVTFADSQNQALNNPTNTNLFNAEISMANQVNNQIDMFQATSLDSTVVDLSPGSGGSVTVSTPIDPIPFASIPPATQLDFGYGGVVGNLDPGRYNPDDVE